MDGRCMLNVAMVCCGLHNVCERHNCAFEPDRLPEESAYVETTPTNLQVTAVVGSASVCEKPLQGIFTGTGQLHRNYCMSK